MRRSLVTGALVAVVLLGASGCAPAGSGLCATPASSPTVENPEARPIAFTSDRAGSFDLWLMAADGTGPVRLTRDDEAEGLPTWSPDGAQLAFMAAADLESKGDICVINADGTGLRNLTSTADRYETTPVWSPDGERIAYGVWEDTSNKIFTMTSDGQDKRLLTDNGNWPSWSPDGERIVYSTPRGSDTGQDLWVMNRDGSDRKLLAEDSTEMTSHPGPPMG